jgi:hypothetical protein
MNFLTRPRRIGFAPAWTVKAVAAGVILLCCLSLSGCPRPPDAQLVTLVSLKTLQSSLAACKGRGSCPNQLEQLSGITRLLGFVVDEKNHDLLLVGRTETGVPSLHLEDFVVALRAAWMKYARLQGNTYVYSNPGCSIDPDPAVISQLDAVGRRIGSASSPQAVERAIGEWRATCKQPQSVRVLGIPFDTHFAQVMVSADYDMKTLADGTTQIKIPGLIGVSDMMLETEKEAVAAHQPISVSPNLNRFWFYPGANVYDESKGLVLVRQCPVQLLTEQMYALGGKIVGEETVDPLADAFRYNVTELYGELGRVRPIYRELENVFRFVAVATTIKAKYPQAVDLGYFLDQYPVPAPTPPVDRTLAGRDGVKQYEHSETSGPVTESLSLWVPSCGGVDIAIAPQPADFIPDQSGLLDRFANDAVARRNLDEVSFTYQDRLGLVASYEDSAGSQTARGPDRAMAVKLVYQPSGYSIRESNGQVRHLRDMRELVEEIRRRLPAEGPRHAFFVLENFTNHKASALRGTLDIQLPQSSPGLSIDLVQGEFEDVAFAPAIVIRDAPFEVHRVENSPQGPHQLTVRLKAQIRQVVYDIRLNVYTSSNELASRISERLAYYLERRKWRVMGADEIATFLHEDTKKDYPGVDIAVEFEGTHMGRLINPAEKERVHGIGQM